MADTTEMADSSTTEAAAGDVDVEAGLDEVAGHLNAQYARLVDLTVVLATEEARWVGPGVHSLVQFLAWRTGISPTRARQVRDVAARADEFPVCMAAFRAGELSLDQMTAIARRAPWWIDAEVCDLARVATAAQLQRALAGYSFPDIPGPDAGIGNGESAGSGDEQAGVDGAADDATTGPNEAAAEGAEGGGEATATTSGADAGGAEGAVTAEESGESQDVAAACRPDPRDRCSFHVGDDGRFRLQLETDAHTGMLVETALLEARDALFQGGRRDVTWTDAAREVAERSLDQVDSPARRNRFRINIHLDTRGGSCDGVGACLPDEIRRHVTCDGLLSPVLVENGLPVSVGRSQYVVPDRTRRLVELRDQGCRVPGCTQHRFLEVHHIIHWLDHGRTDTGNLICLCPHHHRLHHQGRLGIAGSADTPGGVTFTTADGDPITRSGARPRPPGAPPPPPIGTYRHPDGGRLDPRWLYFNPPPEHRRSVMAPPPGQ